MKTFILNEQTLSTIQQNSEPAVIALGFFDGVHKGHQQVILAAQKIAKQKKVKLAVMSFFPHPKTVFAREKVDYLMPLDKKAAQFEALGVDYFYLVDFTKAFASLQPQQFIEQYLVKLHILHAVAGFDYTYGAKGAGTIDTLHAHSDGRIDVTVVQRYDLGGAKVSSTCIRTKLKEGRVEEVTALLGKPYSVHYCMQKGLAPYYTLPEPGDYYATICVGRRAISQRIRVIDEQLIAFGRELNIEQCTIYFHQRITQKYLEIS